MEFFSSIFTTFSISLLSVTNTAAHCRQEKKRKKNLRERGKNHEQGGIGTQVQVTKQDTRDSAPSETRG